jgi:hypothetical protein
MGTILSTGTILPMATIMTSAINDVSDHDENFDDHDEHDYGFVFNLNKSFFKS